MNPSLVRRRLLRALLPGILAALAFPFTVASAQQVAAPTEATAGSEMEGYLRSVQSLGGTSSPPWSLRPFTPIQFDEVTDTLTHPWRARVTLSSWRGPSLLRPVVGTRYNSAFPHGSNDGALWAGRGVTAWAQLGGAARWGPLTVRVEPMFFWTQNLAFPLYANGHDGRLAFADGRHPRGVDRPQRFGDGAYARADLGNSEVRLDVAGAAVGLSNAHEWWGPTQHFPFLLGNNAPGFPHVFAGTSRPVNLWLARLHTRVLWGRLAQSEYFDPPAGIGRPNRFGTGLVAVMQPRGLEMLEIGGARFIHAPWPDNGIPGRYITRAFEGFLKHSLPVVGSPINDDDRSEDGENQLASVFARLMLPGSGFEIYSEFGREDHSWDRRDLVLLPDWIASLTVGLRRSWRDGAGTMWVVRGESMNMQLNSASRIRETGDGSVYVHYAGSNQGHTNRGQLLGADLGVGSAAGSTIGLDRYDRTGRWSIEWSRVIRQEQGKLAADGSANDRAIDVLHSLAVERLLFAGGFELKAGLSGLYNFNRDFRADRAGIAMSIAVTGLPR